MTGEEGNRDGTSATASGGRVMNRKAVGTRARGRRPVDGKAVAVLGMLFLTPFGYMDNEIAKQTGFTEAQVRTRVSKLAGLGYVQWLTDLTGTRVRRHGRKGRLRGLRIITVAGRHKYAELQRQERR